MVYVIGQLLHRMGADCKLWKSYDGKTWERDLLRPPRMPPVPSGTFVRKQEIFQGVLGPEIARTTANNADEFMRRWAVRT